MFGLKTLPDLHKYKLVLTCSSQHKTLCKPVIKTKQTVYIIIQKTNTNPPIRFLVYAENLSSRHTLIVDYVKNLI